jgi:hypothetical protein
MANDDVTAIDTATGLAMHPDMLTPLGKILAPEGIKAPTAPAFTAGRTAMAALYEGMGDIAQAHEAWHVEHGRPYTSGNKITYVLDEDQKAALRNAMGAKFSKIAGTFERNYNAVAETVETLQANIDRTLTMPKRDAVAAQEASEIRAFVKSKPDIDRLGFVHAAIEAGEIDVAQAVLSASHYVSGFDKSQAKTIRDMAETKFAPDLRKSADAARSLAAQLTKASELFTSKYRTLLPAEPAPNSNRAAIKKLREGV